MRLKAFVPINTLKKENNFSHFPWSFSDTLSLAFSIYLYLHLYLCATLHIPFLFFFNADKRSVWLRTRQKVVDFVFMICQHTISRPLIHFACSSIWDIIGKGFKGIDLSIGLAWFERRRKKKIYIYDDPINSPSKRNRKWKRCYCYCCY